MLIEPVKLSFLLNSILLPDMNVVPVILLYGHGDKLDVPELLFEPDMFDI